MQRTTFQALCFTRSLLLRSLNVPIRAVRSVGGSRAAGRPNRAAGAASPPPSELLPQAADAAIDDEDDTPHQPLDSEVDDHPAESIVFEDVKLEPCSLDQHNDSLPSSIASCAPGFEWCWVPELRSAFPIPKRWKVSKGSGETLTLPSNRFVAAVERQAPAGTISAPTSFVATKVHGILTSKYIKPDAESISQLLLALSLPAVCPMGTIPGEPTLKNRWENSIQKGVRVLGAEFELSPTSDNNKPVIPITVSQTVIVNAMENFALSLTFSADSPGWEVIWDKFGQHIIGDAYLNWDDSSPTKYE